MRFLSKSISVFLALFPMVLAAQTPKVQENNQSLFDDSMYRRGNTYRTADGRPGPDYWQNAADYTIEVKLNEETHVVNGSIHITYTNNSPQALNYLWLYLEQNRFAENSRGSLTTPIKGNRYNGDVEGGYTIAELTVEGEKVQYTITDTRMQVMLAESLESGEAVEVAMNFSYKVPVEGMDRMGRLNVKDGTIYAMAQWFPRMAVYDDVVGWNIEPYLGAGEFYLDYGDYDYKVTVPYDHIVVGSGVLQNPEEVLTNKQQARLKKAKQSDETVYIVRPNEIGKRSNRPVQEGNLTWHFKMENSRDVAFGSSKAFIWDAAQIDLPNGEKAIAQSAYPKESDGEEAWTRSTEYTKASIEFYASRYFPYPYKSAVNVAADIGGMEYPGLSFCSWKSKGSSLWGVTDHEFGHNWFPMIVGSNERRYAWMDEGFNTFINHYSTLAFNEGEYPSRLDKTRRLTDYLQKESREGIDNYPDVTNLRNLGYTAYYKPATGLILLREYIIGEERFDRAFASYIDTWAFKHPQPTDFFNHMENVAGENLAWFWKGWFYGNGNIDIAVEEVVTHEEGYVISVANNAEIPVPVNLTITYADGSTENQRLPVEIWQRGDTWDYLLKTDKEVEKVQFDAQQQVPDIQADNDTWEQK
ncbi:M1 family metallopeptidase [Mesonia aquimarina]|uniref:M1 family metallopeptidase n=1 Tax=Mesonia aquimarina TaxID=1504967 RepID=UPI000EF5E5EA|nr:M1 family metallopeptidase [Mesonia aquimarina]